MSVSVITTLHKDGYDQYGSRMIPTWERFFPTDWKIVYYAENHQPNFSDRVAVQDFHSSCPDWQTFYQKLVDYQNIDFLKDSKNRINWYKKTLRWSFKMFAVLRELEHSQDRFVIWLDSDIAASRFPCEGWIENCLSGNCWASKLEMIEAGPHIESGIIIFDTHHKNIRRVKDWIELGYRGGEILKEEKAWDGIWLAKLATANDSGFVDLSKKITVKNKWLHHYVGKRKFLDVNIDQRSGRLPANEIIGNKI